MFSYVFLGGPNWRGGVIGFFFTLQKVFLLYIKISGGISLQIQTYLYNTKYKIQDAAIPAGPFLPFSLSLSLFLSLSPSLPLSLSFSFFAIYRSLFSPLFLSLSLSHILLIFFTFLLKNSWWPETTFFYFMLCK